MNCMASNGAYLDFVTVNTRNYEILSVEKKKAE